LDAAFELSKRLWAIEAEYSRQFPKMKVVELQPEFVALFPMMKSLKAGPNCLPQGVAIEAVENLESGFAIDGAEIGPRFRGPDHDNAFGRLFFRAHFFKPNSRRMSS
jgi:hypothetical protein